MGFDPTQFNDSVIRIVGNGGGMLPEANSGPRTDDLREISIMVVDGNDGRLDPGDYILFYGEGPDKWTYDYTTHLYSHSKNLYSTTVIILSAPVWKKGKEFQNRHRWTQYPITFHTGLMIMRFMNWIPST